VTATVPITHAAAPVISDSTQAMRSGQSRREQM